MLLKRLIPQLTAIGAVIAASAMPAPALAATTSDLPGPNGPPARLADPSEPGGNPHAGATHAKAPLDSGAPPAAPGDYPAAGSDRHSPLPPQANSKRGVGQSSSNTYSNDFLLYRGGWIQTSPHIYIVYWGDWSSAGDPYNVQQQLYYFLSGVGGSAWNKTATQYAYNCTTGTYSCPGSATHIANSAGQLKAWWKDATYVPYTPSATDISNEALRAAAHFGDYSVNAQYVIAVPRGHDPAGFVTKPSASSSYCAYHSQAKTGSSSISFTNLPYMPDAGATGCHNGSVTGSVLDGVSIVESHEYYESETDPFVDTGWDDSTRVTGEGGDKCASYVRNLAFSTGNFPIQAVWSNYDRYYYGSGCLYYS